MLYRLLLFALAALALPSALAAQDGGDPPPDPACPRGDPNVPRPQDSVCIGRLTDDYAFSFVYPRAAVEIPAVDALLREQATAAETWIAGQAAAASAERAAGRGEQARLSYEAGWTADVVTPEIAAFSGTVAHSGGDGGGMEYKAILFDRRFQRAVRLQDLFAPATFDYSLFGHRLRGVQAMQDAFCRELTRALRARRQNSDEIVACPAIEAQPVTLVCAHDIGRVVAFMAMLGPDVAGTWSEGPYEIQIPIDARIMDSLWGRFRPAFGLHQESGAPRRRRGC